MKSVSLVAPIRGVLPANNLLSLDNWRAFIHSVTPIIMGTFVTLGIITNDQAILWIPLVFAVIDPLLSVGNSTDRIRKALYAVMGLLQTGGLIASFFVGHEEWLPIASASIATVNSLLARFYTPTTTLTPVMPILNVEDVV